MDWPGPDPTVVHITAFAVQYTSQSQHLGRCLPCLVSCCRQGRGRAWEIPRAHCRNPRTVLFRASGAESLLDQQCGHSRSRTTAARLPPWSSRYTVQFSLPLRARLSMPSSRQGPIAKAAIRAAWSFCANGETHFNLAQDKLNMQTAANQAASPCCRTSSSTARSRSAWAASMGEDLTNYFGKRSTHCGRRTSTSRS